MTFCSALRTAEGAPFPDEGTIIDDDAAFLGSEGFGYSAYTSLFENLDLVPGAAGVTTIRATGDNNTNTITLTAGNTFNFYGTSYTSLIVSTNGLITFGSANTAAANADLTASPTQRSISPLWDDWTNTNGNAILLQKYDGNRLILDMISANKFDLGGFELVESSEAGMMSAVQKATGSKEDIVFLGWEPHPMNANFDMAYLSGGDDVFLPFECDCEKWPAHA